MKYCAQLEGICVYLSIWINLTNMMLRIKGTCKKEHIWHGPFIETLKQCKNTMHQNCKNMHGNDKHQIQDGDYLGVNVVLWVLPAMAGVDQDYAEEANCLGSCQVPSCGPVT